MIQPMTILDFTIPIQIEREAKTGTTVANDLFVCSSWACLWLTMEMETGIVPVPVLPVTYLGDKAVALTVPVEGVWSWPWHRPIPQIGAVGFRSSSYWGSHRETGSDREPVETAAHSLSPGLTPLWSAGKEEKREGHVVTFLVVYIN